VRLKGYAPSETARTRLVARAKELFRGQVTDAMLVRAGAPKDGNWTAVAEGALGQLATLARGEARLNDSRLTIFGEADPATVAAVQAFYANPLGGAYRAIVDVTAPGAGLGIPELAGVDLQNAQADDCNKAFGAIMARNVINFDTGSAVVSATSQLTLSNLAKVARRCEKFRVEISGHTDVLGDRAMNVKLSEDRARAVRDYLVGEGVAVDRLTYAGFGPDRPRANNRTDAGRAANRRIEFEVKS
jgi:OmpA-OmpF porin, OOP family